ncbi:ParB N-terminal domain-containing protein [Streptomyces sp. HD]|nr:ParB N-terminal domain-containing protein [Streptomyces sp. HD]MDC0772324.1 ParB N-terminal domain-containing protein [Streptomyces sp. HD]
MDSLRSGESPRLGGIDPAHVEMLAQSCQEFEPILVHRATRQVVDGMHRLKAAMMRGEREIAVRYLDGSADDVFVHAVAANITHGLPLTLKDRKAAAERILRTHPDWSDRAIARIAGLSPKTVGAVRRRSSEEVPQSNTRVGQDGRARPLDLARRREVARALLAQRPGVPLREVAAHAGISVSTAHDVQRRMRHGEPETADTRRTTTAAAWAGIDAQADRDSRAAVLRSLTNDPSVKLTQSGRALLRWLTTQAPDVEAGGRLLADVPPHCAVTVAGLARSYAQEWERFAREASQMHETPTGRRAD